MINGTKAFLTPWKLSLMFEHFQILDSGSNGSETMAGEAAQEGGTV